MIQLAINNAAAIQTHLQSLGWMTADEELISLQTAGAGNMNRTLRAQLGDRSLILKQSLPYVARYPDVVAPVERLDVEAAFYTIVQGQPAVASRMPGLIGYDRDHHLLALQDLGTAADYSSHYELTETNLPTAQLLNWLGTLHALPAELTQGHNQFDNLAMRTLNHQHIFQIPLTPDNGLPLSAELSTVAKQFAADDRLKARAAALGDIYLAPSGQLPNTRLLHGDFYPGSWLRAADRLYVIDVEFAFVGRIEFDLGVFLAHCVMTGMQPERLLTLLGDYPTTLAYDQTLALDFAAMEIVRRLLGVAQLPLAAATELKLHWLEWSREQLRT